MDNHQAKLLPQEGQLLPGNEVHASALFAVEMDALNGDVGQATAIATLLALDLPDAMRRRLDTLLFGGGVHLLSLNHALPRVLCLPRACVVRLRCRARVRCLVV